MYPNAVAVSLPVHASWLNQIEIYWVCFISVGEGATLPQVTIFDAKRPGF
jgi:hypothetical protein